MKEWTTPDTRNTPSTTNLEEEDIVDALGNDGNASMPEQVKRPNPCRKMLMKFFFCKYCPEDGPFRPKLVANNRKRIQCYIVVSDGVQV